MEYRGYHGIQWLSCNTGVSCNTGGCHEIQGVSLDTRGIMEYRGVYRNTGGIMEYKGLITGLSQNTWDITDNKGYQEYRGILEYGSIIEYREYDEVQGRTGYRGIKASRIQGMPENRLLRNTRYHKVTEYHKIQDITKYRVPQNRGCHGQQLVNRNNEYFGTLCIM